MVNGFLSRSGHAIRDGLGLRHVGEIRAHDHELVAASPGREIRRAQDAQQPTAEVDQKLVAGGVAECVVDQLESVEVDEQCRGEGAGALTAGHGGLEVADEQVPVREAGQRVMGRVVFEAGLEQLSFGEVEHGAVDPTGLAVRTDRDLPALLDPAQRPVTMTELILGAVRVPVFCAVGDRSIDVAALVGDDEVVEVDFAVQEGGRRVSGELFDRVAHEDVSVGRFGLAAEHRARDVGDEVGQLGFAVAGFVDRLDAGGDVEDESLEPFFLAGITVDDSAVFGEPPDRAVAVTYRILHDVLAVVRWRLGPERSPHRW